MEAIINKLPEDINYMFYIKHRGDKRFSTYNPGKGTMGTGRVFTELYRKEHLSAVCKWISEDNSGEWGYQLRSAGGKKIYWEYDSMAATPTETPQISTETAETVNVSADGENAAETKEMPQILNCEPHTIADLKEIPNISKLAKAGIIINGVSWHTEYLDQTHNVLARVDNLGWHEDGKGFGDFQGSGVFGKTAIFESWDNAVITMIDALTDYLRTRSTEPPHSPKTPQTAECVGDSPETREATYADIENASKELAEQSKAMGTTSVMELPRGIGNPRQVCTYGIRCGLLLL